MDPESILLPILQGSSNVAQILMAWEMLWSQLDLGHQFFLKYRKENHLPETVTSFSPASMSSDLQELQNLPTVDAQMRHVLAYYPHHYTGFEHEPRESKEQQMILSESWEDVIDILQVSET